jgi:hypothetical protein
VGIPDAKLTGSHACRNVRVHLQNFAYRPECYNNNNDIEID